MASSGGALTRTVLSGLVSRRTRRGFLFCLIAVPLGLLPMVPPLGVLTLGAAVARLLPPAAPVAAGGVLLALVAFVLLAPRLVRWLGAVHRSLAGSLLDEPVPAPAGGGWRALGYLLVKLPLAWLEGYAAFVAVAGLADVTYPFWWGLFRNHPSGTHLSPVPALTPFPGRVLHIGTFGGTFGAFALGVAMLLAAPWLIHAVTAVDGRLIRTLLGPGGLAERVHDLETTRAIAVEDSAALLRRIERNLHDGAQVRLATLAMNLGRAREKLGDTADAPDLPQARELVESAHRGAKEALAELRVLARGIHPPVLDNGLPDALATLAAGSAIPVRLEVDLPTRPTPAIETIAYFCAAELLANAAKHSQATAVTVTLVEQRGRLRLEVTDNGRGAADPARGSGLAGLLQRVRTVDGRIDVDSPPGGPTRVTADLPLRT